MVTTTTKLGKTSNVNDNDYEEDDGLDTLSDEDMDELFLDLKVLMPLLQDEGRQGKPKKDGSAIYEYPQLKKLAGLYYRKFEKKKKKIPLTSNKARDMQVILSVIERTRKHWDRINVHPTLLQHIKNQNVEKVFIIGNDVTGGQRVPITGKMMKQQGQRDGSLAIRVVYCLCHHSLRDAAVYWLANRKVRGDLDLPSNTSKQSFGELLLVLFKDKMLQIERPDVMDLDNHDPRRLLDPHAVDLEREWKWLLDTWDEYIKPKYKKVMLKWNKTDTGNGDRTLKNFVNYCNISKNRAGLPTVWLVWVYFIDMQSHFLLASVAGARPPDLVFKEAGFGNNGEADADGGIDFSSNAFAPDSFQTPSTKKARIEASLEGLKARGEKLDSIMCKIDERLDAQKPKEDSFFEQYGQIQKLTEAKASIEADDDFTPTTKAKFISLVKEKKTSIAKKLISKEESET